MPYITFAILSLVAVSGILSLYRQLQILQKSSYSMLAFFKWIKDSYTTELAVNAAFYCAITIGIVKNKAVISLVLAAVLMALRVFFNVNAKKQIEKLAFTSRVKRFYIAAILMLGALVFVSTVLSNVVAAEVFRMICLVLSIVTPALTFVVWCVTYPFEKVIGCKNQKGAED